MDKKFLKLLLASFFILVIVSPGFASQQQDDFNEILGILQQKFVNKVDTDKLYEGAIKGMLQSLNDPYTTYFNTNDYKKFMQDFKSSFSGIGVQIQAARGGAKVAVVMKNSPAQKVGLRSNDLITAVDGKAIANMDLNSVSQLIQGQAGTIVKLTVKRDKKVLNFAITRGNIENPSVETSIMGKTGYLKINQFNDDTTERTSNALKYFQSHKTTSLILDLRDNPGGELDAALSVCQDLLPAGPMIQILNSDGSKDVINGKGTGYNKPIVVLINGGSASAAEVVSGALQDRKAAILIGEKSFGKASVQSVIPLKSGSGLKVTIAHYLTPNGRYIHGKGLYPDLFVAMTNAKQDPVLAKAKEILRDANYRYQHVTINGQNLDITINGVKMTLKAARLGQKYYLPLHALTSRLGIESINSGKIITFRAMQKNSSINVKNLEYINHTAYIPLAQFVKIWDLKSTPYGASGQQFNF